MSNESILRFLIRALKLWKMIQESRDFKNMVKQKKKQNRQENEHFAERNFTPKNGCSANWAIGAIFAP